MRITERKLREIIREALDEARGPCWKGYEMVGRKKKGGKMVPNCVPVSETDEVLEEDDLEEADRIDKDKMKCNQKRYLRQGEPGYGKKQKVVKACDKGKEVLVKFGDAKMRNNRDKPKRRRSFRDRMNCDTPGSKLKPRYWACKDW